MDTTLDIALRVARALDAVGACYFLGGSLASSIHGEPRATNDIDMVVELAADDVDRFVCELGPDFDVDAGALRQAVAERGSWNVFYLPLFTKIDLFVRGSSPFDLEEFARRAPVRVRDDGAMLVVKSPEDSVLRKLLWYRSGGEVAVRQWSDAVEVLRVSASLLNDDYLDRWAATLAVADLLARARGEARLPRKPVPKEEPAR